MDAALEVVEDDVVDVPVDVAVEVPVEVPVEKVLVVVLAVGEVVEPADPDASVTLYKLNPFGPPQTWPLSPAQAILHLPSLTGAEPATRLFPQ